MPASRIALVPDDSVSVTLALGSGPYQKTLPSSLLAAGMLRRVLRDRNYLQWEVLQAAADGSLKLVRAFPVYRLAARAMWATWRRLPESVRPNAAVPALASCWLADQLLRPWIEPSSIFHGCTGVYLACLETAKQQGAITLVEHAARHELHWRQAVIEERRRFGVDGGTQVQGFSGRMLHRMEQIFAACDRILVPSEVARASFAEMGYAGKVTVIHTGVDHQFFSPAQRDRSRGFRVCYVGRVELVKGIGYLLQAWKSLGLPGAELMLVGALQPEMKSVLAAYSDSSVHLTGWIPAEEVAKHYSEASIFVMPSVNEGLAQVLLEAMASGLPVVATDVSGAMECMASGQQGIIVPARNVEALADAILWCYQHREEIEVMGKAARARIENHFTLEHYNQRVIALYRALARA